MYYLTLCTHKGKNIFGELSNDEMMLNDLGKIVQYSWESLPKHFPHIETDLFVIMPNHIHGIVSIVNDQFAHLQPKKGTSRTIGSIVRCLKILVTKWARKNSNMVDIWQRNYYEHVIRDERDYLRVAEYILYNPLRRDHDQNYNHG
jgi:REP element-mobilizing transposase RayT